MLEANISGRNAKGADANPLACLISRVKTTYIKKEDLQKRFKLENERYFELYNIHKEDLANYDLVINTSNITPAQVANVIIEEYEKWLNK